MGITPQKPPGLRFEKVLNGTQGSLIRLGGLVRDPQGSPRLRTGLEFNVSLLGAIQTADSRGQSFLVQQQRLHFRATETKRECLTACWPSE